MLIRRYRLQAPQKIQCEIYTEDLSNEQVLIRPLMWSICKADSRYFFGERPVAILKEKLPLALIHEAIGEVVIDPQQRFMPGSIVIMLPGENSLDDPYANYSRKSKFYSSTTDGFMRELVNLPYKNTLDISKLATSTINKEVLCITELLSVSLHAVKRSGLNTESIHKKLKIAVWGDGSVGFITAFVIHKQFPQAELSVFGKYEDNLSRFSFVDRTINIIHNFTDYHSFDYCFECVGGNTAGIAINQIIDAAKPCAKIVLLGVSEEAIAINTRMVLEKGLQLIGSSRSTYDDFIASRDFLLKHLNAMATINSLITNRVKFNTINDITTAFILDKATKWGKTIITI